MKKTDAWVKANTTPQGYEYVQRLKTTIKEHTGEFTRLNLRVATAEQRVQNMDRELVRLRRELAEARTRGD